MKRVYNYSAGPSMLPVEVLEQAQKEMLCYGESGMSVMEMSHRSKDFEAIIKQAEQDLRELMHIPDNYKVLFVQGGGSTQFAMVPLNLMNKNKKANYINTGQWAKKAYAEAKRYGDVKVIASSEDAVYNYIPKVNKEDILSCINDIYTSLYNDHKYTLLDLKFIDYNIIHRLVKLVRYDKNVIKKFVTILINNNA